MIRIKHLERTSSAVPSIWEGRTTAGKYFFARYRHGYLRVGVGKTKEAAIFPWDHPEDGELIYSWESGDDMDGFMSDFELKGHLFGIVDFPASVIPNSCTVDHEKTDFFGCDICGQPPNEEQREEHFKNLVSFLEEIKQHNQAVEKKRKEQDSSDEDDKLEF